MSTVAHLNACHGSQAQDVNNTEPIGWGAVEGRDGMVGQEYRVVDDEWK